MGFFDLLKKSSLSKEVIESQDEGKESDNGASKISVGYVTTQTVKTSTKDAAVRFAKPIEYTNNRILYDSGVAKNQAKQMLFKDGQIVKCPYTGERLILTKKEAKLLYGDKYLEHLAESDHIIALEEIHEIVKANPWLTVDDVKQIANNQRNMKVTSHRFNNPKRSRSNKEYVIDKKYLKEKGVNVTEEGKKLAIQDEENALKYVQDSFKKQSRKNLIETGRNAGRVGAYNAGLTALTMSGIMNTVALIKGDKSSDEAIADTIRDSGKAAITGYAMSGGLTVATQSLSQSSAPFIKALANSNVPAKVITAVIGTGDTLKKWGTGEITTQECLIELGDKGLNMATIGYSMAVGQALIPIPVVGGAVGALVGSMLTSTYYNNLINTLQTRELEHQERMRIIEECHAAAEQTKAFRKELEMYLDNYFNDYKDCFDTAISSMRFAYTNGDADGMIASANEITRKLGGQVHYETVDEFKCFLDDNSTDIL
ncbi:hypothetical protein KQI77_11715 [Clostridium sp. MSJ-8]|uniref:hypothetical protein n=1 Tax=Clostridium sp. MSJ-8 TaxID=2841510 RepID=UPI001C0EE149|nr:hypothetical protein [Clostridium sp. MSJ-8]MBU5488795.1 hypothetical protein [Clostridium sp. MSJ-8]